MNGIRKAREVAGLSTVGAANIVGVSLPTWCSKEKDPLKLSIGQFFRLYRELDTDAKEVMWTYMEGLKDGIDAPKKFCA